MLSSSEEPASLSDEELSSSDDDSEDDEDEELESEPDEESELLLELEPPLLLELSDAEDGLSFGADFVAVSMFCETVFSFSSMNLTLFINSDDLEDL